MFTTQLEANESAIRSMGFDPATTSYEEAIRRSFLSESGYLWWKGQSGASEDRCAAMEADMLRPSPPMTDAQKAEEFRLTRNVYPGVGKKYVENTAKPRRRGFIARLLRLPHIPPPVPPAPVPE